MKDSLFEMLLNLFEQTLTQLEERQSSTLAAPAKHEATIPSILSTVPDQKKTLHMQFIQTSRMDSVRVFTPDEQLKLSKSSLQLMVRMQSWGIINSALFELILNRLLMSDSRTVTIQETKWAIRHTIMDTLQVDQLAFLDLLLYQKEDKLVLH